MLAPRPARPSTRKSRCSVGPEVSPGVAKGGGARAPTQGAPRCSASAGRAGRGTRRRTVSRPARARRAPTRYRRREALRAPAHRRSRRRPKAAGQPSFQSGVRAAGRRWTIRPSGVGDRAGTAAEFSYGGGLARDNRAIPIETGLGLKHIKLLSIPRRFPAGLPSRRFPVRDDGAQARAARMSGQCEMLARARPDASPKRKR